MELLSDVAAKTHRPAVGARDIGTESPRLGHVADRRGERLISFAHVPVAEPGFMSAETVGLSIRKVLCLIEVAGLVKDRVRNIASV